jgi:hypothetical protein
MSKRSQIVRATWNAAPPALFCSILKLSLFRQQQSCRISSPPAAQPEIQGFSPGTVLAELFRNMASLPIALNRMQSLTDPRPQGSESTRALARERKRFGKEDTMSTPPLRPAEDKHARLPQLVQGSSPIEIAAMRFSLLPPPPSRLTSPLHPRYLSDQQRKAKAGEHGSPSVAEGATAPGISQAKGPLHRSRVDLWKEAPQALADGITLSGNQDRWGRSQQERTA